MRPELGGVAGQLAWLAGALGGAEAHDEGIEAARNACVAGASLATAAVTAAAYYDNPLTGAPALRACVERLLPAPLALSAWRSALAPRPHAAADGQSVTPGFGFVAPGRERAFATLLERWVELAPSAPRGRFWLAHERELSELTGPLNAAGLAALACLDLGLDADAAERLYLLWKLESALREAQKAQRAGLRAIPFDGVRYVYEGVLPPERASDRGALCRQLGLDAPLASPPRPAPAPAAASTARERPELRCRSGVALLGSRVAVHGLDLHADCLELGFVHYHLFCVTGRRFDPVVARVLEELWVSTGYPDARIWCNRVAGYMGSARVDPALASSAALAASNSVSYGFRALRFAYQVQAELPEPLPERELWLAAALAERRVLHGYGRPVHGHDERVDVALGSLARAGLGAGPALRRAFWLERRLGERKGLELNVAAVFAAIAIDFGLDEREFDAFMLLELVPGYMAVYAEQRRRPAFEFLRGWHSDVGP